MSDTTTTTGCMPGNGGTSPCITPDNTPRDTCPDPSQACGCCAGTEPVTPQPTANRPGLSALAYRIGTHSTFLETMLARLTSHALDDGTRPLAALTTRDPSDPSIALLDAWSTVGDVLSFYQERIANEGYLRTATERRSVLELARLIGYSPRPGVAASTYLAYTIDANTTEEVLIKAGARVQSMPGAPGELPQSFETREDLRARAAWNKLVPRKGAPQQWQDIVANGKLYLKGIATQLKVNDPLLIIQGGDTPQLFRVTLVDADAQADRTEVGLDYWEGGNKSAADFKAAAKVVQQLLKTAPEGKTADQLVEKLKAMSDTIAQASDSQKLVSLLDTETLPLVQSLTDQIKVPAPKLRQWLGDAETALTTLRGKIAHPVRMLAREAVTSTASFSSRLNSLITQPSRPLANALQLPRSLQASFRPTSDAGLKALGLTSPDLRGNLGAAVENYTGASPQPTIEVYALRLKAGVFGRNAPKRTKTLTDASKATESIVVGEWPMVDTTITPPTLKTESLDAVFLDANYEGILPGSWIVLDSSAVPEYTPSEDVYVDAAAFDTGDTFLIARAKTVANKVARAEYGMTGDSVRIGLDSAWIRYSPPPAPVINIKASIIHSTLDYPDQSVYDHDFQLIRGTAVYAQSEPLPLADAPIETTVCDGASDDELLELDGLYQDLDPGRFIVVSGERSDIAETAGVLAVEALMITEVIHDVRLADAAIPLGDLKPEMALPGDRTHTFIRTDKPLKYCYQRDSLVIYGNVVKATHGETRTETLGSGDGSKALQSFVLKQPPLTYLAAPTAVGAESTLQAFVNNVRWHEQSSFVDLAATDRAFITKTDDDSNTTVTFGNGREGARLPTGIGNISAVYRFGIGQLGNVRAGQLSLLSTRPHGVKEVTNPLRASGGADRETRDQARESAPLAVMSLDRLVSTQDYADFARSFAGIGKAAAAELSDGQRTVVHVTIAGTDDIPIDTGSDLYLNLRRALIELGDPFQPVQLAARDLLQLVISAGVRIDPDYLWEDVVTNLRTTLLDLFGFQRRALAQDVAASEVLSAMQSVRGVVYIDLDAFGAVPAMVPDPGAEEGYRPSTPQETADAIAQIVGQAPAPRVLVMPAQPESGGIQPAQLAVLVPELPATLVLNQIKD